MARAYFDQNPFGAAPIEPGLDVIRRVYSQRAPTPMESLEGLVKSPVTNLAVAGISRLVRESEADERQAALEQQRADQVAALEGQRKAAAERALGIERQIGELEAPRMVTPQVGMPSLSELSAAAGPVGQYIQQEAARNPATMMALRLEKAIAAGDKAAENEMIAGLKQAGMFDVAFAIDKGGATAAQALRGAQEALRSTQQSRMQPQEAPGEAEFQARRRLMDMGLFSEPLRADIPPTQSPFGMFYTSQEGAKAFNRAAEIAEQRDQGLPVSPEDQEFLESVVASMRSQGQKGQGAAAVLMDPVLRAQMREAMMPLTAEEAAIQKEAGIGVPPAVQERLDQRAALQERLAQERQAVREAQAAEAAVPEVERLPRTFADYATQYAEALDAGDNERAARLLSGVEGAVDIIPKSAMEALTGSPQAKARMALMQIGMKARETRAKAAHDAAKLEVDRSKAVSMAVKASAAARNAGSLDDLRVAQGELARAKAGLAKERASKVMLEAAKLERRLKGSKGSKKTADKMRLSALAIEAQAMLADGSSDLDPDRFASVLRQIQANGGPDLIPGGTHTLFASDPASMARLLPLVSKADRKISNDIVNVVKASSAAERAQERIAIAESNAQLAEQRAAGGAGIGEFTSAIKVLRDVARDSKTPKEDKDRAKELVRYYLGRLGGLTRGETPAAQAATAASKLSETASETQTLLDEAKGL